MPPQGLRPLPYRKVARRLMKLGFHPASQEGGHVKFRHADGRWVVVPQHAREEMSKDLVAKIVKQAGIDADEFMALR